MKKKFKRKIGIFKIRNNKWWGIEYTLTSLINESTTAWDVPEWGIPKGRRNYQEKDLQCGLREFEEETGYLKINITNNSKFNSQLKRYLQVLIINHINIVIM